MTGSLIKKEIFNKILDFRFVITSVIAIVLVVFSVVILSGNYKKEVDIYETALKDDKKDLQDVKTFSLYEPKIHYRPNPLSIFNNGITDKINKTFTIQYGWIPRQTTETESENPFLKIFRHFDLTTVFQIVLSLLALLLIYDAICGEREEGTLGLMLSYKVKRSRILLSKLVSNIFLLSIPVLLSFIISFLIITVIFGIGFSASGWIRIGLIVLSTLLFLTFILSCGLLVSSFVKNSSVSLLLSTCLWIILCLLQPNLNSFIASSVIEVPSNDRIEEAYSVLWDEFEDRYEAHLVEIDKKVPEGRQNGNVMNFRGYNGRYAIFDGTTPLLLRYLYITREIEPLRQQYAEKEWNIYKQEYLPVLEKQFGIQRTLDRFSQAAIFYSLASSLSRTDVRHYEYFLEKVRNYRNTLMFYLNNDRKIFSDHANEYFTQLDMDEIHDSKWNQREANGTYFGLYNTPPLDLSEIPEFRYQHLYFRDHINDLIMGFLLLLSYSLIVFLISMYKFVKYDPRQY
jgi:ABC-type transport system involved in multi-copper enzyme maturation permease subunit